MIIPTREELLEEIGQLKQKIAELEEENAKMALELYFYESIEE